MPNTVSEKDRKETKDMASGAPARAPVQAPTSVDQAGAVESRAEPEAPTPIQTTTSVDTRRLTINLSASASTT
jgi:hypothetical protein